MEPWGRRATMSGAEARARRPPGGPAAAQTLFEVPQAAGARATRAGPGPRGGRRGPAGAGARGGVAARPSLPVG